MSLGPKSGPDRLGRCEIDMDPKCRGVECGGGAVRKLVVDDSGRSVTRFMKSVDWSLRALRVGRGVDGGGWGGDV